MMKVKYYLRPKVERCCPLDSRTSSLSSNEIIMNLLIFQTKSLQHSHPCAINGIIKFLSHSHRDRGSCNNYSMFSPEIISLHYSLHCTALSKARSKPSSSSHQVGTASQHYSAAAGWIAEAGLCWSTRRYDHLHLLSE